MANNRLILRDPINDEEFELARSMGSGWYVANPELFASAFAEWIAGRTEDGSAFGVNNDPTNLRIVTDGRPEEPEGVDLAGVISELYSICRASGSKIVQANGVEHDLADEIDALREKYKKKVAT